MNNTQLAHDLHNILGPEILGNLNINTGTILILKTIVNYLKSN